MTAVRGGAGLAAALAVAAAAPPALAQGIAVPEGIAPQVIPMDLEPGGAAFTMDGAGGGTAGAAGGAPAAPAPAAGASYPAAASAVTAGGTQVRGQYETAHLATLARQPYGAAAIEDAQNIGVNPNTTAAFANAESRFRNVPAANGSTSANGVWQVTNGTWNDTVARNDLGYTGADRSDPEAQAVVANRVIRQYAAATQNAIGRGATTQETYGSYVFGPSVGPRLVAADDGTPMRDVVPEQSLRNNGMASWNVGQWRSYSRNALGPAATQAVLTR